MFKSNFVDFFSRTPAIVVPILFVPVCVWMFWYGLARADVGIWSAMGLFGAGFVTWTLTEYWLHRTAFHWIPNASWGKQMHFLVHGVHHDWPKDKYRLVMPPAVSIALYFLFLGIFYALFGSYAWPFQTGFVIGYVVYDLTHYYIHHFTPKTKFGVNLKKHHMLHHYKYPDKAFGVSSRVWDSVFATTVPAIHRKAATAPPPAVAGSAAPGAAHSEPPPAE